MKDFRAYSKHISLLALAFVVGHNAKAQATQSQRADQLQLNTITTAVPYFRSHP